MVQVRIGRNRPRFSATDLENETKRHCRLGVVVLKDVPRVGGTYTFPVSDDRASSLALLGKDCVMGEIKWM